MDDSTRLFAELQTKLQELDHKVAAYQQDLAAQYNKYAENLLRNVPDDVSTRVKNAIAETMTDYPSLGPALLVGSVPGKADDNSAGVPSIPKPSSTPIATPPPTISNPDVPRSPRARDAELTGLFTPSYLPLLDSTDRNERYSSIESSPAMNPATDPISFDRFDQRSSTPTAMSSSYEPASPLPKPPTPRRRNTDEVSIRSDGSGETKRRSALRRVSSSSKAQSPRKVRFEFEGMEFTTTSSPKPSAPIGQMEEETTQEAESNLLDSDDEAGSEMVEDINDSAPPKRVSSSQALRNLSRGPLEDDGTKWTEVVTPPDGSVPMTETAEEVEEESEEDSFVEMSKPRNKSSNSGADKTEGQASSNTDTGASSTVADLDAENAAEAEDVLAEMTPVQKMRSSKSQPISSSTSPVPPLTPSLQRPTKTPLKLDAEGIEEHANRRDNIHNSDDEEELFGFEESPTRPRTKYLDHSSSEDETTEVEDEGESPPTDPPLHSTSTSKPIVTRPPSPPEPMGSVPRVLPSRDAHSHSENDERKETDSESGSPSPILATDRSDPSTLFSSSYNILPPPMVPTSPTADKGLDNNGIMKHPFNTPVIDPALHEKLHKIHRRSFVGSVSGKSGVDESNAEDVDDPNASRRMEELARSVEGAGGVIGSFRDAGMSSSISGPRSLSERMRLEEYMESRNSHR